MCALGHAQQLQPACKSANERLEIRMETRQPGRAGTWVLGNEGEEAREQLAVGDFQEAFEQDPQRHKILGAADGEGKSCSAVLEVMAAHRRRRLIPPHAPATLARNRGT